MRPRLQLCGMNSILMETLPLSKCFLSSIMISLVIPVQHVAGKWHANALAKFFYNSVGGIEEVISVDKADVNFIAHSVAVDISAVDDAIGAIGGGGCGGTVCASSRWSRTGGQLRDHLLELRYSNLKRHTRGNTKMKGLISTRPTRGVKV